MNPSAQGTLWLHVGPHKTGTTSIQRALQMRRAELTEAGIACYPEKNAWKLANALIRPELNTSPRVALGRPRSGLAEIESLRGMLAVARRHLPDMVISSEEFSLMRTALEAFAVRHAIGVDFNRIVPILFIRNIEDWWQSRADQLRKTGNWGQQKVLPDALSTDGEWYYDQDAITGFWSAIGYAIVLDYDLICREEGGILPAFARALGQPCLLDGLDLRLKARSRTDT